MDETEPERKWWRKRRWWAAVAVLHLALVSPLSIGPAQYAATRGWVSPAFVEAAYQPLWRLPPGSAADRLRGEYQGWWFRFAAGPLPPPRPGRP